MVEKARRYHFDIVGVSSTKRRGFGTVDLDGGWKLFYSGADHSMSAQEDVGILTLLTPIVRLSVRLDSSGITDLHVETQDIGPVIVPIART